MTNDRLLKPKEVAAMIGCKSTTLAHWRWQGKGPKFIKLETKVIRYKESEVQKWLESESMKK